jgi:hypothetical protein
MILTVQSILSAGLRMLFRFRSSNLNFHIGTTIAKKEIQKTRPEKNKFYFAEP